MAAETGLTKDIAPAQSIDFVEQFGAGIKTLQEILGITRVLPVPIGGSVKVYSSVVTLDGTTVAPGDVIPLSQVQRTLASTEELTFDKKRKSVPAEDIQKSGYDVAVIGTDESLLRKLRAGIKTNIVTSLASGTGTATGTTLQAAMAQAKAKVSVAFEDDDPEAVAFINPLDLADYQADHTIGLETAFGLQYLQNFMGFNTVIVTSAVTAKKVYATAMDNIVLAYAPVSGELGKAFAFTTDAEVPMLGVLHSIQADRMTAETVTISAIKVFAERLDGVVVSTVASV